MDKIREESFLDVEPDVRLYDAMNTGLVATLNALIPRRHGRFFGKEYLLPDVIYDSRSLTKEVDH